MWVGCVFVEDGDIVGDGGAKVGGAFVGVGYGADGYAELDAVTLILLLGEGEGEESSL